MKKLLFAVIALICVNKAESQVVFSVKPGLTLTSASVGVIKNKSVPFVGLQYLSVWEQFKDNNNDDDYNMNIIMPYVGCKYYLSENTPLRGYLSGTILKPIFTGSSKNNGQENENFKDQVNSLSSWYFEGGFGSEYYFGEHFSISGEFGLRIATLKSDYDRTDYNGNNENVLDKVGLGMTYATIGFNFIF
jgi:hypothetical protein